MFVKVCCIKSIEEAELALYHGANAIGLVSEMPSGPGVIPESTISDIASSIGDRAHCVLLTSLVDPRSIAEQFDRCSVNALQLCEWLPDEKRLELRSLLPDAFIMQVVHVTGPRAFETAAKTQEHVDALLLDSGTLTGSKRELGGTGRTHDWSVSQKICRETDIPVFLAGGLQSSNVASAVEVVRPHGLDVCSGVRTDGNLDPTKLKAFVAEVRKAVATR